MKSVSDIYLDGSYAGKNPTFGDDNAEWKVSNALEACRRFNLPHRTIAEVGCGAGAIIRGVAGALGAESAVGYEPMPQAYAIAKERETEILRFLPETIGPATEAHYDLMLCFDVFEHVEDYFGFLRNLKPLADRFLFHIPLDMNAQMIARGAPIRRVREQVGHLHYFSKDTALAALRECGYRIDGSFYTCGADSVYGGLRYRLMKLPRKISYALAPDLAVRVLGGYSLMVAASLE